MQRLPRPCHGVDRVRGDRRFAEALQDQLELARIVRHVPDREHAGKARLAGRRIDPDVVHLQIEPPAGDRAEIGRKAEKREQRVGRQKLCLAFQGGHLDRGENALPAMQPGQLIRDDEIDLAARRRHLDLGGALRGGAEPRTAMHDGHAGDVLQRERPINRRIPAAGDHHPLVAEVLAPADVVLHRTRGLVGGQPGQGRPVGAEGAGAGGDEDGLGAHRLAPVGADREGAGRAFQALDPAAQQTRGVKRRDLVFEPRHQLAGGDRRVRRDVIDRLFGIQRGALPAGLAERVDQHRAQLQHPQFEHREQTDRAGSDDGDVGFQNPGSCRFRTARGGIRATIRLCAFRGMRQSGRNGGARPSR